MLMAGIIAFYPLFVCLYVIAQTFMLRKLIHLIRHPGHVVQAGMAASCFVTLCVLPGLMLLTFGAGVWAFTGWFGTAPSNKDPLALLTFSRCGVTFAMCSWAVMTGWFAVIIARPKSLYRGPVSLVPIVVLALICLTFSLGVGWMGAGVILRGGRLANLGLWAILAVLFYIPTAPLPGFVLLIMHVWRMLPSGGRVTMLASGEESQNEGDMS